MTFNRFFNNIICLIICLIAFCLQGYTSVLSPNDIKEIQFPDFSGVNKYITLNGTANIQLDSFSVSKDSSYILRLTPRISNPDGLVAGSAFLKIPFEGSKTGAYSFSTFFRLRITANNIYDGSGIVFTIHSDSRKDQALGKRPDGMGFSGDALRGFSSVSPSVGVKFNVQAGNNDLDYNTIGIVLNGRLSILYPAYGYPIAEARLNNGIPWNVWVDYDGNFLTVHSTQSPYFMDATKNTRRPVSLKNILTRGLEENESQPEVYIGFTADPGFYPAYHDILEWHFRPYYKPYGDYCGDPVENRPESCFND